MLECSLHSILIGSNKSTISLIHLLHEIKTSTNAEFVFHFVSLLLLCFVVLCPFVRPLLEHFVYVDVVGLGRR